MTKKSKVRHFKKIELNGWMKVFLFYGRAPARPGSKAPQDIRVFIYNSKIGGSLCNPWVWLPVWQAHAPELRKEWLRDHTGPCWAERELADATIEAKAHQRGEIQPLTAAEFAEIDRRTGGNLSPEDISEIEKRINRD
jgi:hypothetical protein